MAVDCRILRIEGDMFDKVQVKIAAEEEYKMRLDDRDDG